MAFVPKKRAYVMMTTGQGTNRVGQVIDYLTNKSETKTFYAVRLNYNGQVLFLENNGLRKPTQQEKTQDKKLHNREIQLERYERSVLEMMRYDS